MNNVFSAAAEVQSFCQERGWRFCFIGGIAVQRWSDPRQTEDADLTLLTGFGSEEGFVEALLGRFMPRTPREREAAVFRGVVLLQVGDGTGVDIALGALPFEEHAVDLGLLLSAQTIYAGSATWKASPATGDWNTATNWTPQVIPNAASDTATFATSNRTAVSLSGQTDVNGIVFNAGASAFTINAYYLNIGDAGIANNSGNTQNFSGKINFVGGPGATAGSQNIFTLVNNTTGSGMGQSAVQVNGGTLGGNGIIAGTVTVGTGANPGAILLPGISAKKPANLTINSALTFNALSTYKCVLNRITMIAGEVTALGVTINPNATFAFVDTGTGTLSAGTVFTVINNTSASPIGGTFSNLPDGSTFIVNGDTFKADYQGGDGNDLTLTVIP